MSGPIGILGGTFDPVHHGHLRLALELRERLALSEVRLVPLQRPPHRHPPVASGEARLAMLERAIAGEPGLVADPRELKRGGISYTVETLTSLREEFGTTPLCLMLGMDAFRGLPSWRAWDRIPHLAHLVIARRPGASLPEDGPLAALVAAANDADWAKRPAGAVLMESVPLLDISSSAIRARLARRASVRYLLPDPVLDYLREHKLYRGDT